MSIQGILSTIRRQLFKAMFLAILPWLVFRSLWSRRSRRVTKQRGCAASVGFLNIEYFDLQSGGFGGYGMAAKNITDRVNTGHGSFRIEMILARSGGRLQTKSLHGTSVIVAPAPEGYRIGPLLRYAPVLQSRRYDLLMTMDFYPGYLQSLLCLPVTPVLIWINDPRPAEVLEKIATVSLEMAASQVKTVEELTRHAQYKSAAMKRLMQMSRSFGREILFGTPAHSLIPLAKKTYGLDEIEPFFLPIPVEIPAEGKGPPSARPSLLLLGRLDPIKRPWIFFECAKRFPEVEFLVAGITHYPKLMEPVLNRYQEVSNLKFLGLVAGEEKNRLLNRIWGVVNTSVHEAVPVSFLESMAYAKPIVGCQNPDEMVERFGFYTGEVLGDGFTGQPVEIFSDAIERLLTRHEERAEKGIAGRRFVAENYSFENFERTLRTILVPRGGGIRGPRRPSSGYPAHFVERNLDLARTHLTNTF